MNSFGSINSSSENAGDALVHLPCPVCNRQHQSTEAELVYTSEQHAILYIECKGCGASLMIIVLREGVGTASLGIVTDLEREDVSRLVNTRIVSADDLLELHQFLSSPRDEVRKLFKAEAR